MKITDRCRYQGDEPIFICDYSPPKSGKAPSWEPAANISADYIAVAYNPGKAVRTQSAFLALAIRENTGRDVVFNLGTRDMNKLAIQSLLLGAQTAALENILVLQGDPFTEKQLTGVVQVQDYTPTSLIRGIREMNDGMDYKGLSLEAPTDFCIGATVDLSRGLEKETHLAVKKVRAGAHFLVTQPVFESETIRRFLDQFEAIARRPLDIPIFWGLQVFVEGGFIFSNVPSEIQADLGEGRSGVDIASEVYERLKGPAINRFYLIPPILKGGRRDYEAAQAFLAGLNPA